MALLQLPKELHPEFQKKNKQPLCEVEVDWSNPLARGLVGVYLLDQAGQNLVTKESFRSAAGDFTPLKNSVGHAWEAGTSGDLWDQGHLMGFNDSEATVVMHSVDLASGSSFARPVNYADTGSPNDLGWLLIFESSDSNMYWTSRDAGTWSFGTARADFGAHPGEQVFTCRVDNSAKDIYYNLNGTKTSDIGLAGQNLINITAADKFHLGDINDTINGQINTVFLYNRKLSDAEDEALHADIYQILKPATPQFYFVPSAAGGDTNVNASTEVLTITEQAASVTLDVGVTAATEALTITEHTASISLGVNVTTATESLTITENIADIALDVNISTGTELLAITSYQAVVDIGGATTVQAETQPLTVTGQQASIGYDVGVNASTESLTLTTNAASVALGANVEASVESLSITGHTASIERDVDVQGNTEALSISTHTADIESQGATTLTPQDITNIVDALFAKVIENGETFEQQLKLIRAEAAGKVAVSGNTVSFRDAADSKDRIVATVDEQGQRTAITTDVS